MKKAKDFTIKVDHHQQEEDITLFLDYRNLIHMVINMPIYEYEYFHFLKKNLPQILNRQFK